MRQQAEGWRDSVTEGELGSQPRETRKVEQVSIPPWLLSELLPPGSCPDGSGLDCD